MEDAVETEHSTLLRQPPLLEVPLNMAEAAEAVVATRTYLALLETPRLVEVLYLVLEAAAEEWLTMAQPRLVAHGVVIRLEVAERLVLAQTMMGTMETTTYSDVVMAVAVGRMTVVTEGTVESQVGEAEAEVVAIAPLL